ncbi:3811_t:CDS:2 [Dentiscutata erythropus]|uniref:3811_t:CDS:1 n=1 Tax=Dentiscutata erythropus TaxID=1348616 RepID=A0A9N8VE55_9GLOM|nr:3811_t:CDS:2 [Dentiscutata erythropus]
MACLDQICSEFARFFRFSDKMQCLLCNPCSATLYLHLNPFRLLQELEYIKCFQKSDEYSLLDLPWSNAKIIIQQRSLTPTIKQANPKHQICQRTVVSEVVVGEVNVEEMDSGKWAAEETALKWLSAKLVSAKL